MSSILRALKKLDEEAMSREGQTGEQKIKMRQMINRRTRAPRVINRFLSIFLVLLLLGTAAYIIMKSNRKQSMTKKRLASATGKPLRDSPQKGNLKKVSFFPQLKQGINKKQDTSPKERPSTHLSQQPPALKKESPKVSAPPAITLEQSKPSGRSPQPGRVEEDIQAAIGKKAAKKTKDQKELVKKNKHPEFILNGVIWSDNPGMRVALINDRYLREGDSINGVSVISINKKAVTLQSGAEKWTIRMKK